MIEDFVSKPDFDGDYAQAEVLPSEDGFILRVTDKGLMTDGCVVKARAALSKAGGENG